MEKDYRLKWKRQNAERNREHRMKERNVMVLRKEERMRS